MIGAARGRTAWHDSLRRITPQAKLALDLPDLALPPPVAAPPPPDPALLEAVRAEGEAEGEARGFADGLAEGMRRQAASQQAAIAASLAAIAAAMRDAEAEGTRCAAVSAEALATTLLAAMDAALPAEAARCGAAMIARIAAELLPALADRPEARLVVAPSLTDAVSALLPRGPEVVGQAEMPAGDARIEWRDGARIVSLARRREAVRAALAAAGFNDGDEDKMSGDQEGFAPVPATDTQSDGVPAGGRDLDAVYDIPVQVSAVLGRATMQVSQLLKLGRGAVVELDRKLGEAVDIYVNNRLVARGEVVMVDDNRLGVTMTEIVKADRGAT